jgi:hypothetical protein
MVVPMPMGWRRKYAHVALGWSHGLALTGMCRDSDWPKMEVSRFAELAVSWKRPSNCYISQRQSSVERAIMAPKG